MESTKEVDSAECENPTDHILLNEGVLSILLSCIRIPLDDFKNFRLVCKAWNEAAFSWLMKGELKLCFEVSGVQEFNNFWSPSSAGMMVPMSYVRFKSFWVRSIHPTVEKYFQDFEFSVHVPALVFCFYPGDTLDFIFIRDILFGETHSHKLTPRIIAGSLRNGLEMFEDRIKMTLSAGPFPVKEIKYVINVLKELMLPHARKINIYVNKIIHWCGTHKEIPNPQKKISLELFMQKILLAISSADILHLEEFELHLSVRGFLFEGWMSLNGFDLALKDLLISQKVSLKRLVLFANVPMSFFKSLKKYHFDNFTTLEIVNYKEEKIRKVYNMLKSPNTNSCFML